MNTYTAFCQQASGGGTVWIQTVEAKDLDSAIDLAREECAADWEYALEDVHVLGVAAGSIEILMWDDLGD